MSELEISAVMACVTAMIVFVDLYLVGKEEDEERTDDGQEFCFEDEAEGFGD